MRVAKYVVWQQRKLRLREDLDRLRKIGGTVLFLYESLQSREYRINKN